MTTLPPSVPVVGTLLTKAESQMTPTETEDLTTSRKDFDNVPGNVSSRPTSDVHHVECRPRANSDVDG